MQKNHVFNTLIERSALFWYVTQLIVLIRHRRFGITYRSHLKDQEMNRLCSEQSMNHSFGRQHGPDNFFSAPKLTLSSYIKANVGGLSGYKGGSCRAIVHSLPSSVKIKNMWSFTSNPAYAFMVYRHIFTLTR